MAPLDVEKLKADLVHHEGKRNNPYFDSRGYVTFGIGRNLEGKPLTDAERAEGLRLGFSSDAFVDLLFQRDVRDAVTDLEQLAPWVVAHPEPVQRALANMSFQMGYSRLAKFAPSFSLIQSRRYKDAGQRLRRSLWARQTPKRAHDVISLIESCEA